VLKINSRRDKLHFERVEFLYGNSNFTQVTVYDFIREADVYMKYGKLTMENVVPGFSKIYVESDFTDVSLMFEENSTFEVDILHHEKATLQLPYNQMTAEESFEGEEHYRTRGQLGDDAGRSKVTIDALQKCYIKLSVKK
jgi:hypothetical protein